MILQGLKNIGGDLNCAGNKELNENSFPSLEFIGGDIILSNANFATLPPNLIEVKGRGILSKSDPITLLESMRNAEKLGIIKGGIFFND
jgi:hypothetical protein